MTEALPARKPRVLWANYYCLLDQSSGASISVRQMLLQLIKRGFEVEVLGATLFDTPAGAKKIEHQWPAIRAARDTKIKDGPLLHHLVTTPTTDLSGLTSHHMEIWFALYQHKLEQFKPDLVFMYGGRAHDQLTALEARIRGIPVVAYLANGNYKQERWCRDIDLVLTDSRATADHYRERIGIVPKPVGKFIAGDKLIKSEHKRERILFVNPNPHKGGYIVLQIALMLLKKRPDIPLEVVESRGRWQDVIAGVGKQLNYPEQGLPNVTVTPTTDDMSTIYARTRLVLHPSLWWESGSRVLSEAMLNGIPAIITDHGGQAEMIEDAGLRIILPEVCHRAPYNELPGWELIDNIVERIIRFYDDEPLYQKYVARARHVGEQLHDIEHSTDRLLTELKALTDLRIGDRLNNGSTVPIHKLGLDKPATEHSKE